MESGIPRNPIYSHAPREVQTVRCCGRIYKRWRFVSKRFWAKGGRPTHAHRCAHCGQPLIWPAILKPDTLAAVRAQERFDHYHDQRVAWLLAGRNSKGRPFGRTPNYLSDAERLAARRRRGLAAWRKRVRRLAAQGLTTRGQSRMYKVRGKSELQQSYDQFRAGISTAGVSWDTFEGTLSR
jgi:hypothetical protein